VTFPGQEKVIEAVAAVHPDLQAELSAHREYHGHILPTLFMADVQRWAADRYRLGDRPEVERLLGLLEHLYAEGGEGEDLVAVGFIEAMDGPEEPTGALRLLLGPEMAEQYRVIWGGSTDEAGLM